MNNKNKWKLLLWSIRAIFLSVFLYSITYGITTKKIIKESTPIKYRVIETKYHQGGRGGGYFTLQIIYNNKPYELGITSKMNRAIKQNQLPKLYYNNYFNGVVSNWQETMSYRAILLMICFFLITFLPISKMNKFLDNKIKEKKKTTLSKR